MFASISVNTFNRKKLSEICIDSVLKNTPRAEYELVVVDDCSTDGTQDMLKGYDLNIDKLILNPQNLQLGPSTNIAWDLASKDTEWLINLSNDHYAMPGWWDNVKAAILRLSPDYLYTVLRPGSCNYSDRRIFNVDDAKILVPDSRMQIGGGLAIRQEAVKKYNLRFQEKWNGVIGSVYSVMHEAFKTLHLTGYELAKPCVLVQDCEFNNPEYADYYDKFFSVRGTQDRLKRLRETDGYMTKRQADEYYKDSGYAPSWQEAV